jgi:hypothetical protein
VNNNPFLIFALPRSRTAWLSVMLTEGNVRCYHEGIAKFNLDGMSRKLTGRGHIAGNSDSGMSFFHEKILADLPGARIVVIRRPLDEVRKSMFRFGIIDKAGVLNLADAALNSIARRPGALVIDFKDIDLAACVAIWNHVAPGEVCNTTRFEELLDLNIQIHAEKFNEGVERARAQLLLAGEAA